MSTDPLKIFYDPQTLTVKWNTIMQQFKLCLYGNLTVNQIPI